MRRRLKVAVVALLAGALVASGAGAALAVDTTEPDLETVRAEALDRIADRTGTLEARIAGLEGTEGVRAEQLIALWTDGLDILEVLAVDVEAAGSVEEIVEASRAARAEYGEHRRIRFLYAHTAGDLFKFSIRAEHLERGIEWAGERGIDTAIAVAELEPGVADLETARVLFDAVDPSGTGEELLADLKEAHQTAHKGNRHLREGRQELREAIREWFVGL